MKKFILLFLIIGLVLLSSCGYRGYVRWFRSKLAVIELIKAKEEIDKSTNPAKKYFIESSLIGKLVSIQHVVVKDIIPSSNIDYNFCVVVEIPYEKGNVECYLYSKNIYEKEDIATIAQLTKGKSIINAVGEFSRFFTLLDEAFVKIELINTSIDIVGEK